MSTLSWGRHYLMAEPTHYRIDYAINPFMDTAIQPDPLRARAQWDTLRATIEELGGRVDVITPREDSPDMVYAMNLGFAATLPDGGDSRRHVLLSHMRFPERRNETLSAAEWFAGNGWGMAYVGKDGIGPTFEAGDVFPFAGHLVAGTGPRTDEMALKTLAAEMGVRVLGVRTTHAAMYHLDLAFCPLDDRRAIICPDALAPESAQALLDLIPEPLVITEDEALTTFAANSIVIGRTVVMPSCPDRVRAVLEGWGFTIRIVDMSQLHLGGGSVRCVTNPLDIVIGRDVPVVYGGEVIAT
ncbi:N-dimethylarginine dimethylaminohydrolase [Nocardioides albertanoniae]|uniref:N-dimethylarginine dimethylaminohydrolase n=1 Tax=Nocardioides albertanoniae TaxID=1175486 RepID=A0A543A2A3_9ACTN|nr:arginine deiminase family protein [Nocardioides albertanoniae]TQL66709.1 N-dimethylarginine dimethylaminohydrolase [Nocardioides albertanoniae]